MTSHNATISNGTYQNNIGSTTLKAFCNDTNGFAIYAAGYTNNTIGETNSNKLVSNTLGAEAIVTGLATAPGNPDVSNWAMKLTATSDSGDTSGTNALTIDSAPNTAGGADASFNNYHTVPNEFTKVAHKNAATSMDETTGGATLTTTYAAYISKTQAAGSYQGQVIYTLVHPASANSEGCNPDATTITEALCMQDFTGGNRASIVNSMALETQYTLKDKRDGKSYTIAKLADGNVWMTQNLDLDLDASKTYTNEDTDIGYNTTTGEYDIAAWSPMRSTYTTSEMVWCADEECADNPESYDPGDLYWNGQDGWGSDWGDYWNSCEDGFRWCDLNLMPTVSSTGISHHHLGNYYNWTAAVAVNNLFTVVNDGDIGGDEIMEQSICPVGWTLPRDHWSMPEDSLMALLDEYGLADHYDDEDMWFGPLYLFRAGAFYDSGLGNVGFNGVYESAVSAGLLFFGGETSKPQIGYYYNDGGSIRCVARPVVSSISGD